MKKIVNISHSDLDGITCSILLNDFCKKNNIEFEFILCTYRNVNDIFKELLKEKYPIFITDISIDESLFENLDKRKNLYFIDHHPRENPSVIKKQYHSINEGSAALMVYNYLSNKFKHKFSKQFKIFANVVSDYDTWTHKFPVSRNLNTIFFSYYYKDFFKRFENGWNGKFNDHEKEILKQKDEQIQKIKDNLIIEQVHQNVVFIVTSEEVDIICEYAMETKDVDYCFNYNQKYRSLSIRSRIEDGLDVGKFLTQFGGGGHKRASAVRLDRDEQIPDIIDEFIQTLENCYYLYHPESDCVWIVYFKDERDIALDNGLVYELTKEEYLKIKDEVNANSVNI